MSHDRLTKVSSFIFATFFANSISSSTFPFPLAGMMSPTFKSLPIPFSFVSKFEAAFLLASFLDVPDPLAEQVPENLK